MCADSEVWSTENKEFTFPYLGIYKDKKTNDYPPAYHSGQ